MKILFFILIFTVVVCFAGISIMVETPKVVATTKVLPLRFEDDIKHPL